MYTRQRISSFIFHLWRKKRRSTPFFFAISRQIFVFAPDKWIKGVDFALATAKHGGISVCISARQVVYFFVSPPNGKAGAVDFLSLNTENRKPLYPTVVYRNSQFWNAAAVEGMGVSVMGHVSCFVAAWACECPIHEEAIGTCPFCLPGNKKVDFETHTDQRR